MKFIPAKNAPDIPLELLQAQENDNLILFCGAGISYPAGLPLFNGLVKGVYEELSATATPQEQQAIEQWRYDTALELLERRYHSNKRADKHAVRRAIATRLTLKPDANIDTHKAILQLAKTKQHDYRLVTTNVDRGFILADANSREISDTAPKLPVPKAYKWHSIVYLHGLIDEQADPNSEHLIFTSGDFGAAYLTERWASRFVTELFRHFTVLFVGYSIDDPVMRYMTDAIAADRRRGDSHFKEPYALAGAKEEDFEKAKLDWQAKGVKPLLYEDSDDHINLHKTLHAWAAYCRDGLDAVERVIRDNATKSPIEPYEHDDAVQLVIGHLNKDEYAAKIFSQLNAPITWLPVLDNAGLLSKVENQDNRQITHNINQDLIVPHQITYNLWQWLVEQHLETRQLVEWVIEKGTVLHPRFINFIEWKLRDNTLKEPFLTFWRVIALKQNNFIVSEHYEEISKLEASRDYLNLLSLSKLFEPKIKFSKSFSWDGNEPSMPYDAKVIIQITRWDFKQIKKYADELTGLLLPVTQALKQAMECWQLLEQADNKYDNSYWYLSSISPHHQNRRHDNWSLLIELCRDLWQAAYQTNKTLALAIVELWKTIPFPVFKRLIFHAYTVSDIASPVDKLNYLLTDNCWWLWSVATQRETFRLLAALCPQLTAIELSTLEQAIISGAPREMYKDDLTDEEWQSRNDREIWLHLAKLESFNVELTAEAKAVYNALSAKYPNWQLQEDERDEFSHWISSMRTGRKSDLTMDSFIELSVAQQVEALLNPPVDDWHSDDNTDFLRTVCQDKPDITLNILNYLAIHSNWNASLWYAGLLGLSEIKTHWLDVAKLIIQFPNELFEKQAWVISWWTSKAVESIEANSEEEQYFWRIFDLLITNAQPVTIDIINQAINRPIGILTEALMNRFSVRKINAMERIPDGNLLSCVNKLVNGNDESFLPAKVILISRLHYFYAIDPDWTRINLIPLLNWKTSNNAAIFWQGFISNNRVSVELALELKSDLLATLLEHNKELGEDKELFIQLFANICFSCQMLYSVTEQQKVLNSIGVEGLISLSEFISRLGDDKKQNDLFWKNRIKPFFKKAWLRDGNSLHPKISEHFALMCLVLDEEFVDAVKTIKAILTPFKDISFFLSQLKESEHIANQPLITFDLLADIFDPNMEYWIISEFRKIINDLVLKEPSLKDKPKYQEIDRFLKSKTV